LKGHYEQTVLIDTDIVDDEVQCVGDVLKTPESEYLARKYCNPESLKSTTLI
jgi:hypothetical protein